MCCVAVRGCRPSVPTMHPDRLWVASPYPCTAVPHRTRLVQAPGTPHTYGTAAAAAAAVASSEMTLLTTWILGAAHHRCHMPHNATPCQLLTGCVVAGRGRTAALCLLSSKHSNEALCCLWCQKPVQLLQPGQCPPVSSRTAAAAWPACHLAGKRAVCCEKLRLPWLD